MKKKPLTRQQSARAIIDYYDDLTNSEIQKLPAVERNMYFAAIDFFHAKEITHAKPKRKTPARRTTRPIRRKSKAIIESEMDTGRGKTRGRKKPVSRRKKTIVDKYPELDVLDNLETMIAEVQAAETERYHSQ